LYVRSLCEWQIESLDLQPVQHFVKVVSFQLAIFEGVQIQSRSQTRLKRRQIPFKFMGAGYNRKHVRHPQCLNGGRALGRFPSEQAHYE
jgi:hypothetical protein